MWPWLLMSMRTYAPYITLPFAAVVGFIGYNMESLVRKPSPPQRPPIKDERNERLLTEMLESKDFYSPLIKKEPSEPKTIFDKNVSPSLVTKD